MSVDPRNALQHGQTVILLLLTAGLLFSVPAAWNFTPDSGFYIGTANNLVEEHRYWFNGQPNLQYYPGLVLPLSALIAVYGLDFSVLQLLSALFFLLTIWLVRAYFPFDRYGHVGLVAPILVVSCGLMIQHYFLVLSDVPFVGLSLVGLLAWRSWRDTGGRGAFALMILVAMYLPLLRFQGLLFVAALGLAYFFTVLTSEKGSRLKRLLAAGPWAALVLFPFVFWTWRNYHFHTPDTFNMANAFFFGKHGLSLYAPDSFAASWIDADWKYPVYRVYFMLEELLESFVGTPITDLLGEAGIVLLCILMLLGVRGWWQRASAFERSYVLLSTAFLFYSLLKERPSLYVVPRYWLPILPFMVVMLGFGVTWLVGQLQRLLSMYWGPAISVLLMLLVFLNGAKALQGHIDEQKDFEHANHGLAGLTRYATEYLPENAIVATSDWGVLPLALQRESVMLLNDKDHRYSLARMQKYNVTHVAVLKGISKAADPANKMINDYPSSFSRLYSHGEAGKRFSIGLYEVNLPKLANQLGAKVE